MNILPYFYHIVNTKTNQFYFGYRCKNKHSAFEDLGCYYFTSNPVIQKNFTDWEIHEVLEFNTKEEAYDYEQNAIRNNVGNELMVNKHYVRFGKSRFANPKGKLHSSRAERLEKIDIITIYEYFKDYRCSFKDLVKRFSVSHADIIYLFKKHNFSYQEYTERNRRDSISKTSLLFNKITKDEVEYICKMIKEEGLSLRKIYNEGYSTDCVKRIIDKYDLSKYVDSNRKKWCGTSAQLRIKNKGGTRDELASRFIIDNKREIENLISLGYVTKEIMLKLNPPCKVSKKDLDNHLSDDFKKKLLKNWRTSCRSSSPRPI